MAPSLNDYEFQFGDTGVVLNTDDMGMPFIDLQSVSGLDTAPLRSSTDEHQGMDGAYVDSPFVSARTIVLTGNLYTDPDDTDTLLDQLRADYTQDDVRPFYFQLPGRPTRFINCQGGGFRYDIDGGRRAGLTAIQATLVAEDPYIYDATPTSSTVAVPTLSILGTSFNMAFNMGFGGPLPNFGATVTNNGNHTAYPIITITGPVTNPVLVDSNSGTTMALNISLSAGDTLVIDTRLKSIVLNNYVSRRTAMAGRTWISVPPGISDTISFTADNGTGSCTVQLYNTYY
jgi:phage-related protein